MLENNEDTMNREMGESQEEASENKETVVDEGAQDQSSGSAADAGEGQPSEKPEDETGAEGEAAKTEPEAEAKPAEPTAEDQLAEMKDRYLRLRAEFDNYRKRMAREALEVRENAKCQTVGEMLDVYDLFLLAMEHASKADDMNAIREGLKMIFNSFKHTFDNLGVTMMDVVGKDFNPKFHEAVSQEPSNDVPEGKVIRKWKNGFMMGERLLRPATVVVSSGPAAETKAQEGEN